MDLSKIIIFSCLILFYNLDLSIFPQSHSRTGLSFLVLISAVAFDFGVKLDSRYRLKVPRLEDSK